MKILLSPVLMAALLAALSDSAVARSPAEPNGTDAAVGDLADAAGFTAAARAGFWVAEHGVGASDYFHQLAVNSTERHAKARNLRKAKLHSGLMRAGFFVTAVSGVLAVERMLHAGWAIYAVGAEPLCGREAICESPSTLRKILVSRSPTQEKAEGGAAGAR